MKNITTGEKTMKNSLNNKITATVAIAAGILCLSMNTASAAYLIDVNTQGVDAFDRYAQDNSVADGTGDFLSASQDEVLGFPGRLGAGNNRVQLWDFNIPEVDPDALTTAFLRFSVGNITDGAPDFEVYGSLSGDESTRTTGSYEDAAYSTLLGTLVDGVHDNTVVAIDIRDFVRDNFTADGGDTWVSFRIQSSDLSAPTHNLQLAGFSHGTQIPTVTLSSLAPEPSSLALLILGAALLFGKRKTILG